MKRRRKLCERNVKEELRSCSDRVMVGWIRSLRHRGMMKRHSMVKIPKALSTEVNYEKNNTCNTCLLF